MKIEHYLDGNYNKQALIDIWWGPKEKTHVEFKNELLGHWAYLGIESLDKHVGEKEGELPPSIKMAVALSSEISGQITQHNYINDMIESIEWGQDWESKNIAMRAERLGSPKMFKARKLVLMEKARDLMLKNDGECVRIAILALSLAYGIFPKQATERLLAYRDNGIRFRAIINIILDDQSTHRKQPIHVMTEKEVEVSRKTKFCCDSVNTYIIKSEVVMEALVQEECAIKNKIKYGSLEVSELLAIGISSKLIAWACNQDIAEYRQGLL